MALTKEDLAMLRAEEVQRREDSLYPLLVKLIQEKGVDIPTVNLSEKRLDELRRLLVEWDTGNPVEALIIDHYALPDEPGVVS